MMLYMYIIYTSPISSLIYLSKYMAIVFAGKVVTDYKGIINE
jgi:hypothetical protein